MQEHNGCCNSKASAKKEIGSACFDCRRKRGEELLLLFKQKIIHGYEYSSTRNGNFKRLEPHFQISATRSARKEVTEIAVALPQTYTKEPISGLRRHIIEDVRSYEQKYGVP